MMYTDWRRRWAQAGTVVPNGRLPPLHRTAASRATIVFALQFFLLRSLIFTHRDALGNVLRVLFVTFEGDLRPCKKCSVLHRALPYMGYRIAFGV